MIGYVWRNFANYYYVCDRKTKITYEVIDIYNLGEINDSEVEFRIENEELKTAIITKVLKTGFTLRIEQRKYYKFLDTLPISKTISIFKNNVHYAEFACVSDKGIDYIRLLPLDSGTYQKYIEADFEQSLNEESA